MRDEYIVLKASLPLGESLVERSLFNRTVSLKSGHPRLSFQSDAQATEGRFLIQPRQQEIEARRLLVLVNTPN